MDPNVIQEKRPDILTKFVKSGECILFLGAGVNSTPPDNSEFKYAPEEGPPLGKKLTNILAEICNYRYSVPNEIDYTLQRVSLCFELDEMLGRKELIAELTRQLINGKKPSPILRMLAALPVKIFVTTNYDKLLEQALRIYGKDPKVLVYNPSSSDPTSDIDSDPTELNPLIFKMHGDLDKPESIVITDEDYITFIQRMSEKDNLHPVPFTVRFRMLKWPTLFIGYSLLDYNLRLLFRTLRWRIDEAHFPKAYSVDLGPDPLILKIYQNQKKFVTFVITDLWTFIPDLYEAVIGKRYAG